MDNIESIKERVKKLLRLARDKGASEAEASLAAAKAQALLEEYKLSSAELGADQPEAEKHEHQTAKARFRDPMWKWVLRRAVTDTTYCWGIRGRDDRFHIFGKPSDIAVALELYDFLAEQVERIARFETRGMGRSFASQFRNGCAHRVGQRLREAFKARQEEIKARVGETRALVLVNDLKVSQSLSRTVFPAQRSRKSGFQQGSNGFQAGKAAGDRVRINLERKVSDRSGTLMLA